MTRLLFSALLFVSPAVYAAGEISFNNLCPGPARVERSAQDPKVLKVYCVDDPAPKLIISNCPGPAQVVTRGLNKYITCPGPWGTVTLLRTN